MAGIAALAIAYVLSQFYRSFLAVLTPVLGADLDMTKADLSAASGIWFMVFALSQFLVGIWLDRFGPRRTAALMLVSGAGAGALLFAIATQPWMVIAAMALIGFGCAPILMAMLFIFARSYSPARFAVLASWSIAFGMAGNVMGAAPLAAASEAFGWRPVMAMLGILSVLVAAALFFFVRDPAKPEDQPAGRPGLSGYGELLRIRTLWLIIPIIGINNAASAGIRGLWAGPYLEDIHGLDTLAIGQVTTFMALAMVAGSFLYGPLDTILRTRKWVAFGGNMITLTVLTLLALNPMTSLSRATGAMVVLGMTGMAYGVIIAHARAFLPAHLVGRGMTLMNFFAIGGIGAMQFATGGIFTAWSTPADPLSGYVAVFSFYALAVALALTAYFFARDARVDGGRP